MDFVRPVRTVPLRLVAGRGHYDTVIQAVREARSSVWIATANLKELMVEDNRWSVRRRKGGNPGYRSVLEVLEELVHAGVSLRILHAARPSGPFRIELRRHPALIAGGRPMSPLLGRKHDLPFEMRICPRVHLKMVAVDGRFLYLGSANFTGAGLGVRSTDRRNFELGIVTDDDILLDHSQEVFDRIWSGAQCAKCALRQDCASQAKIGPADNPKVGASRSTHRPAKRRQGRPRH